MNSRAKLIIFDWDGTLADSVAGIVHNIQQAIALCQLPMREDAAIRDTIGLGWQQALLKLYPQITAQQINNMRLSYIRRQAMQPKLVLFDGIETMLVDLHQQGCLLAVATGKGRRGLDHSLQETGLSEWFSLTRTAEETCSKPDPMMLQEILDETGISADQAVMVGDTTYDLDMAKALKMPSIGLTYGAHSLTELESSKPSLIVDTVDQLHRALNRCIEG